jgi:anti-sigma B factor antagonist
MSDNQHDLLSTSPEATMLRTGFDAAPSEEDGTIVVRLRGELDMATAPRLGAVLNDVLDGKPSSVELDLTTLSFVDSTGIRVLIAANRRAGVQSCDFVLRHPTRSVLKALKLTRVDSLVRIDPAPPHS